MAKNNTSTAGRLLENVASFMRICLFRTLSVGPIPGHIAFIMDGNRRYAQKENMKEGAGHRAGFSALISILKYCHELRVKYVTIYAFSIDNFKRRPDEVQDLMELMLEKIDEALKEESFISQHGIRVHFIGNLALLSEPVRVGVQKIMSATASNTKCTLLVCVAYTSIDEIVHAVQESCTHKQQEFPQLIYSQQSYDGIEVVDSTKRNDIITHGFKETLKDEVDEFQETKAISSALSRGVEGSGNKNIMVVPGTESLYENKWDKDLTLRESRIGHGKPLSEMSEKMQGQCYTIKLVDIEKYMYMAVAPEPDILIRSSGETRLSNFLLWQANGSMLYSPDALWPEIGLWHLVWAVLNFQRNYSYLKKKKKQL